MLVEGKQKARGSRVDLGISSMAQELGEDGAGGLVRIWSERDRPRSLQGFPVSFCSLQVDCVPRLDRPPFTLLGLLVQPRERSGPRGARRGTGVSSPPWPDRRHLKEQISVCGGAVPV